MNYNFILEILTNSQPRRFAMKIIKSLLICLSLVLSTLFSTAYSMENERKRSIESQELETTKRTRTDFDPDLVRTLLRRNGFYKGLEELFAHTDHRSLYTEPEELIDLNKALIWAAIHGHTKAIRYFITFGAQVAATNHDGRNALTMAAKHGHAEAIACLIEFGADLIARDGEGWTPLHHAVQLDQVLAIKQLITLGAPLEATDRTGWTALHHAAALNFVPSIKCLVKLGANREARTNLGSTPLHLATFRGQLNATKCLHELGANLNAENNNKETPFHKALQQQDTRTAELLYTLGSPLTKNSRNGLQIGNAEMQKLCELIVRVQSFLQYPTAPVGLCLVGNLFFTIVNGGHQFLMKKFLKDTRCDVNHQDLSGQTPLHRACAQGHYGLVRVLLAHRLTNLLIRDREQRTALDVVPASNQQKRTALDVLHTSNRDQVKNEFDRFERKILTLKLRKCGIPLPPDVCRIIAIMVGWDS